MQCIDWNAGKIKEAETNEDTPKPKQAMRPYETVPFTHFLSHA